MKHPGRPQMNRVGFILLVGLYAAQQSSLAGRFTANFDDGAVPKSCRVFGQAKIETTGGTAGSGVLVLTKALSGQIGSFIVDDLDPGTKTYGFNVSLLARVGGGTEVPADGWSFCVATDLPDAAWGEEGAGNGLIVAFDTFDNGAGEAPAIEVRVGGRTVAYKRAIRGELETGTEFVPVHITLSSTGALSIQYGSTGLFADIPYPPRTGLSRARFGLGARTGGSTDNHFIDDLSIETILTPSTDDAPPLSNVRPRLTLAPFACCDGQVERSDTNGEPLWQIQSGSSYMYFKLPPSFGWTAGQPLYAQVVYADTGTGTLRLEYDSTRGNNVPDFYAASETHTRSSRANTGRLVSSFHELAAPKMAGRQNGGADLRLSLGGAGTTPLAIKQIILQAQPFEDAAFQYVLSKPWLAPYSASTRTDVSLDSLRSKVMVGYQGWFRTPNDLSDRGWVHWCRDNDMIAPNFSIDQWPDIREYSSNELFRAGTLLTRSGQPAYLFSSTTRETVRRHFQWMRKYNIDGAFLQRFVHPSSSGAWGNDEWVLHHVREAANQEGRIWAIEYDVSSLNPTSPGNEGIDPYAVLERDWKWLVDVVGVRIDPHYAHEHGKPVVFVWGLPYPDRGISHAVADRMVEFLRHDPQYGGNYVIGGIPWWWRTMTEWHDHIRQYDGVLAWMPPSGSDFAADFQTLASWGIDYFPHAWPGFSWANLQRQPASTSFYAPRDGGRFLWDRVKEALNPGSQRLFIGMFDEYDEGTAIMPMSDDPPQPSNDWGRFVTNEGRPSDWWMVLAGQAKDLLLKYRLDQMPSDADVGPRAETGPEASIELGEANQEQWLHLLDAPGSRTVPGSVAGKQARANGGNGSDQALRFLVDPAFARAVPGGLSVTIEVEYLDQPPGIQFALQYDSVADPERPHPKGVMTQGTGEWRTVRYTIADAYFGTRQPDGSDFRIQVSGNAQLWLHRVRAVKSWDVLPQIDLEPEDRSVREGEIVSLTCLARGTAPLSYQWWFNGTLLSAATGPNLEFAAILPEQAGRYFAVAFTPTGTMTSRVATVTVKLRPKIHWPSPADIVYGTPLSSAQLNASADAPGIFAYDPPLGTFLPAGAGQILSVRFQPDNWNETVAQTMPINVLPAPLTISTRDATRSFGSANPAFEVVYAGFVGTDNAASLVAPAEAATEARPESPPGVYPISVQGAVSSNYTIQFVPGSLTVTKGTQTITFDLIPTRALSTAAVPLQAVASSGLPVTFSIAAGPATVNGSLMTLEGLGVVHVRASQPGNDNFLAAADVERRFEVVPPIRSAQILPNGAFTFLFTGEPDRRYALEASRDLQNWIGLTTQLYSQDPVDFTDSSAVEFQWRFYRVVLVDASSVKSPGLLLKAQNGHNDD